ncbi:jmjC domain-containing protein 8 isoform X3 [Camarhynchus parvulus]|uniref:jmjC domain-containing protein 8 isoform X3 n=1 Tax=Geospiza parvula TaxID=87175 RepID=UPI00123813BB|nr:jmjC domain-containing protein 8 isoform X3 [Camarhynchus parvulus]
MAAAARLLPLLLLPLGWARPGACTDPLGGGWLAGTVPEEPRCTVERADASLTYSLFLQRFAFSRPVILGGVTDNSAFRALCTREKLLAAFGPFPVRLSTANTYSYRKVDVPFQEYVEHLLKPQDPARLGSALRAPSLPHPRHQPRLQLRDRSAGFCTRRIKPRTSTPTRRRWPGSSTPTPRCPPPSARWSAPCALGRCCTSLTAGGTPRSTWTPASSSPPS